MAAAPSEADPQPPPPPPTRAGGLRRLLALMGVDPAIGFTLLARGWSVMALPVTFYCIAHFLTKAEQDYFFTFDSLLGLQVFFDLGIAFVVLQFASHERAHLEWDAAGRLVGDPRAKARLGSLLGSALRVYRYSAVLLVLVVLPVGLVYFHRVTRPDLPVVWQPAWLWAVFATGCNLLLSPMLAFIEGCGLVSKITRLRMLQQITGALLSWSVFFAGGRLLAAPAVNTGFLLVAAGWLWFSKRHFLRDILAARDPRMRIHWFKEVWPLQWRISLSWLSGFFIFKLFSPVLQYYHPGTGLAGRMGMTMRITDSISTVCQAWMSTKAAPFGSLIARRKFLELDALFFRSLKQSYVVLGAGQLAFLAALTALHHSHHAFGERLLGVETALLLVGVALMNHLIFAEAVYLRAHKQEPFLWLSVAGAGLNALTTYFGGRYYGATGAALGYFLNTLMLGAGLATYIFQTKRRAWHS